MRAIKVFRLSSTGELSSPVMDSVWHSPTMSTLYDVEPARRGIHAYRSALALASGVDEVVSRYPIALALMRCEGDCILGTDGIVAQSATIRHIWVSPGTPLRLRALLRRRYGCRVSQTLRLPWWPAEEEWSAYLRRHLRPSCAPLIPYSDPLACAWRERYETDPYARLEYLRAKHFSAWLKIQNSVHFRSTRWTLLREYAERTSRYRDMRGCSMASVHHAITEFCRRPGMVYEVDGPVADALVATIRAATATEWDGVRIIPCWDRSEVGCVIAVRDGDTLRLDTRCGYADEVRYRHRIVRYLYGARWARVYTGRESYDPDMSRYFAEYRIVRHSDGSATLISSPDGERRRGIRFF